jgi:hypothetical protein
MSNPWEKIDLNVYEEHMSSDSVLQLQDLKEIMKYQISEYPHEIVAILGIAGGNWLDNINPYETKKVFGLDVNREYLEACEMRYKGRLHGILELQLCDLSNSKAALPSSEVLICNLIIEYLGIEGFVKLIKGNFQNINVVSCVIQKNNDVEFVSESSLSSAFEPILSIHHDIDASELIGKLCQAGMKHIKTEAYPLTNGKEFIRIDFKK